MPVTHLVNVILRPGVESIQVQYKYQSAEVWTNYNEGQRIPGGVVVKFAVTTYPNFTLTEWQAYYADEYDDTVNISLSPVTGQSAWEFILPSADVYIRCEAESSSGGDVPSGIIPLVDWPQSGIRTVTGYWTVQDMIRSLAQYHYGIDVSDYSVKITGSLSSAFWGGVSDSGVIERFVRILCIEPQGTPGSVRLQLAVANNSIPQTIDYDTTPNGPSVSTKASTYTDVGPRLNIDTTNRIVTLECVTTRYESNYVIECRYGAVTPVNANNETAVYSHIVSPWDAIPSQTQNTIRYILSPESAGEIDASAPSEFVEGTTEFTFKWRIKAAYEFRRLTPFAVGDGSLEDDITYSLDSYDGDTRTYTFTVNNIPNWAIGVRVLIESIYIPDSQDAIGDNSSSGPIGGDGTFDDTSDSVPLPAIPAGVSAADSGFVTLFRPTIAEIKDLGNYLWSNLDEFWENLQKIFTNPMDYIISLNTLPVNPPVNEEREIYIGNWITDITMPPVRNQFYEFDCGTVSIREYFGSFLDYASNTRARIMLPFIGDRDLNINEIMNKTLRLWYRINLLSGECLAALTIGNDVYYQWNGNCAIPIPLTGSDWSRLYGGIGRTLGTAAGFALGGLAGAATFSVGHLTAAGMLRNAPGLMGAYMSIPSPAPALPPPNQGGIVPYPMPSAKGINPALFGPDMVTETFGFSRPARAALQAGTAAIVGHNVMGSSPRVVHSGDIGGGIGIMGNRTPYIVLEYPNVSMPSNYKHIYGYPSNQYAVLGSLSGYTQCKTVMFESTTATDDEVALIVETLKNGVYL